MEVKSNRGSSLAGICPKEQKEIYKLYELRFAFKVKKKKKEKKKEKKRKKKRKEKKGKERKRQ